MQQVNFLSLFLFDMGITIALELKYTSMCKHQKHGVKCLCHKAICLCRFISFIPVAAVQHQGKMNQPLD